MMGLLNADWDVIEKLVDKMLNDRIRAYAYYNYFIVDDSMIVIKIYDEGDELMFTVKAKYTGEKLEVIDVW